MSLEPDWKAYESQIHRVVKGMFSKKANLRVAVNEMLLGLSGIPRQVDVSIRFDDDGASRLGIVECKHLNKKVDIGKVDGMIGKQRDLGADFGMIVSSKGFSDGAIAHAKSSDIQLQMVEHEFLKNYGFMASLDLDEIFIQETEYRSGYCTACDYTNVFEIKVVRGFAEFENVNCPKCKTFLFETRTDGGHRVIDRIQGNAAKGDSIVQRIRKHILATRRSWDRRYANPFVNVSKAQKGEYCQLCFKLLKDDMMNPDTGMSIGDKVICTECFMSQRYLLFNKKG